MKIISIKISQSCAYLIVLLALFICPIAMAEEQNKASDATITTSSEKITTQNVSNPSILSQFIAAIDAIKFKLHHLFDVSLAPKIIAIINAIETQCTMLIELVTGPPQPSDAEKVDTIINNVESQRKSLWDLLLPSSSSEETRASADAYIAKLDNTNKKDDTFKMYAH